MGEEDPRVEQQSVTALRKLLPLESNQLCARACIFVYEIEDLFALCII